MRSFLRPDNSRTHLLWPRLTRFGLVIALSSPLSLWAQPTQAAEAPASNHPSASKALPELPAATQAQDRANSIEPTVQIPQEVLSGREPIRLFLNPPPADRSEYALDLHIPDDFVPQETPAESSTALTAATALADILEAGPPVLDPATSTDITVAAEALAEAEEEAPYNVPIVMDSKVEGHIRFFKSTIRDKFEMWLTRLSHYHPIVERIFTEFGLPTDLVYLSLVESGFNPHAYSRARATGPWQFMKGTGKSYGLRVDRYVDERRDPIKSTVAAARYLRDLYDLFGSWPLAMAAYNAGEGKVMRALRRSQSESFSEIAKTRHIRRETKEYVPRFMAATVIAKNPDRYGFQIGDVDPHEFDEVIVGRSVHLRAIANASGVAYDTLHKLNPELRLNATPPDDRQYHLKVPVGTKEKVERVLDRVPSWKAPRETPRSKRLKSKPSAGTRSGKWYRVRRGDTLISIAKRFHLSVRALKERNNVSARHLRAGDLLSIR